MAPDHLLCEMVFKAKTELQRFPNKLAMAPMTPPMDPSHILTHLPAVSPRTFSSPELQNQCLFYNHMEAVKIGMSGFPNDYYYLDNAVGNLSVRGHRRLSSLPDFPAKICQYFNEGYCKHGSSCRYSHEQVIPEGFFQMYDEDQGLQADSYLADIQKHGKAGYNVTKLLASRENDIPSVDRPYGLPSLVLAEDTPKYMQYRNGKHDPCQVVSASRQIYLTFPAESTFTTEDVENYFNTFGPVEDVRIPYQQKRMFGFVTFSNANTVKTILQKGNPHFVCESRVLVKPYREKSKLVDRKYSEIFEHPACYSARYFDMQSELISMSRDYETSNYLERQHLEEQEQAFEFDRRRLAALQLARKSLPVPPCFDYSLDGLKISDHFKSQPAECLGSKPYEKPRLAGTSYTAQDSSQGLNLPDNPFASPVASGISSVV
ncbi:Zinc finger CCCH domain-containing protein 18 [Quillaja saponaria]|nr:Zinc finger CCCH domain-containing protein 18 [Quillaja saponaria]